LVRMDSPDLLDRLDLRVLRDQSEIQDSQAVREPLADPDSRAVLEPRAARELPANVDSPDLRGTRECLGNRVR
jgi:hypothetical protein